MSTLTTKIICSICLEGIDGSETETVALDCGHVFDHECIQQCFRLSNTCPICKQRTSLQVRRLFFSAGSPSNGDDYLTRKLNQTIEDTKLELTMARDICEELRTALELTQAKCNEVEILHKQAVDDCVNEKKENLLLKAVKSSLEDEIKEAEELRIEKDSKITAELAISQENIKKIHANITKGFLKEICIKEKQLFNANDKIKRLSATKSRLEEKLDKLRDKEVNNETRSAKSKKFDTEHKNKPVEVEDKRKNESEETMEQRFRNLEKQMLELKIQNNKATYNKKKIQQGYNF